MVDLYGFYSAAPRTAHYLYLAVCRRTLLEQVHLSSGGHLIVCYCGPPEVRYQRAIAVFLDVVSSPFYGVLLGSLIRRRWSYRLE
jgi:hypothetical protein